ncbi:hypothetical protein ABLI39_03925 [Pseudarthrobacter sp. B907]|uniref:hypothetical protein n=1 Tax=Pseudarthrobacter sp. B907 TaxID=3158261 RepID=UPI0032DAA2FA
MTWPRISDDYSDDCWKLSDAAFRLHTEALVWNARKLLDCSIPKSDLPRFAKHPEAVGELVKIGFWSDFGDHYVILHHARYQRTSAEAMAIQQRNRENGAKPKRGRNPNTRERWNPTGGTETQLETQAGTQMGTQMGSQMETQGLSAPKKLQSADDGKKPGNPAFGIPTGNPPGNPEGLVHRGEGSVPPELRTGIDTLDPDMWPTDDVGIQYREKCEESNAMTVEALVAVSKMTPDRARRVLVAAYPGRRF